ncbi:hypothetical protein [Paraburkholderia sp. UCT2]|uniref:hypothetical protein n=1 Tax=Paraburkholderia sp. UCT2 TaxID=2615208 RepID=UPI00165583F3|nr:hypothetical protein [Paraburkholderia sp. UCT2]MBC8728051.1 hypothetical protein [Paraburkholderia sp. UCT2]
MLVTLQPADKRPQERFPYAVISNRPGAAAVTIAASALLAGSSGASAHWGDASSGSCEIPFARKIKQIAYIG